MSRNTVGISQNSNNLTIIDQNSCNSYSLIIFLYQFIRHPFVFVQLSDLVACLEGLLRGKAVGCCVFIIVCHPLPGKSVLQGTQVDKSNNFSLTALLFLEKSSKQVYQLIYQVLRFLRVSSPQGKRGVSWQWCLTRWLRKNGGVLSGCGTAPIETTFSSLVLGIEWIST